MKATYAWAVVVWQGGIMAGIGMAEAGTIMTVAGGAISLIGFHCISKFGEAKSRSRF